jgi:hypothetical protein
VEISDIKMVNVRTPMLFRLGSRLSVFRKDQDVKQTTGSFENVVIRNVKAQAAADAQLKPPSGILITGVPGHDITGLTLENIEISLAGGGTLENARHQVPEAIDQYPEVKTFGPTIPAYGLWARHVNGLILKNIRFNLENNDLRPAIICQDGKNVSIENLNLTKTDGNEELIRFEDVAGGIIKRVNTTSSANAMLKVEGNKSKHIVLKPGRKMNVLQPFLTDSGVDIGAVQIQ